MEIFGNIDFSIIEKLEKKDQLNVLLELLQEKAGSVAHRRQQFQHYWLPQMAEQLKKDLVQCEYIKEKIRQITVHEQST